MHLLPPIFAFLVAAAGFYYIMHASGAENLAGLETESDNRLRIRLRRVGGALMMGLALAFYVGYAVADRTVILLSILTVIVLLPIILFLAIVDLRLTRKMRESFKRRQK